MNRREVEPINSLEAPIAQAVDATVFTMAKDAAGMPENVGLAAIESYREYSDWVVNRVDETEEYVAALDGPSREIVRDALDGKTTRANQTRQWHVAMSEKLTEVLAAAEEGGMNAALGKMARKGITGSSESNDLDEQMESIDKLFANTPEPKRDYPTASYAVAAFDPEKELELVRWQAGNAGWGRFGQLGAQALVQLGMRKDPGELAKIDYEKRETEARTERIHLADLTDALLAIEDRQQPLNDTRLYNNILERKKTGRAHYEAFIDSLEHVLPEVYERATKRRQAEREALTGPQDAKNEITKGVAA